MKAEAEEREREGGAYGDIITVSLSMEVTEEREEEEEDERRESSSLREDVGMCCSALFSALPPSPLTIPQRNPSPPEEGEEEVMMGEEKMGWDGGDEERASLPLPFFFETEMDGVEDDEMDSYPYSPLLSPLLHLILSNSSISSGVMNPFPSTSNRESRESRATTSLLPTIPSTPNLPSISLNSTHQWTSLPSRPDQRGRRLGGRRRGSRWG